MKPNQIAQVRIGTTIKARRLPNQIPSLPHRLPKAVPRKAPHAIQINARPIPFNGGFFSPAALSRTPTRKYFRVQHGADNIFGSGFTGVPRTRHWQDAPPFTVASPEPAAATDNAQLGAFGPVPNHVPALPRTPLLGSHRNR